MVELHDGDKIKVGVAEFLWTLTDQPYQPESLSSVPSEGVLRADPRAPSDGSRNPQISPSPERQGDEEPDKKAPVRSDSLQTKRKPSSEGTNANSNSNENENEVVSNEDEGHESQDRRQKRPKRSETTRSFQGKEVPNAPKIMTRQASVMYIETNTEQKRSEEEGESENSTSVKSKERGSQEEEEEEEEEAKGDNEGQRQKLSLKRKREENEEELRAAEKNRHVKTRRLSTDAKVRLNRIFEPNPCQLPEIENLLLPELMKCLEKKGTATIFDFESFLQDSEVGNVLEEKELDVRDEIYQTLASNRSVFITGDLVQIHTKSAISWRLIHHKPKINKTATASSKPSLTLPASGMGEKSRSSRRRKPEPRMIDKMDEQSESQASKSSKSKPKTTEPEDAEFERQTTTMSIDPMDIEMDIDSEFKKYENEIRAQVHADVKKAKEMKAAGLLPKWEPDEEISATNKTALRRFTKTELQDLLLFLIKKFMSQSQSFEIDEDNVYSDHVEMHWLPLFAKLILGSRS